MDNAKIAQMLRSAADTLALEEVMYALGLDSDHIQTVEHVEATDSNGRTHLVEVPIDPDLAETLMDEAIAHHEAEVEALREAANFLDPTPVVDAEL